MTQTVTLEALEQRVAKLEEQVRQLRQVMFRETTTQAQEEAETQMWDELRRAEIVVDPSPKTLELAAEWEALPAEEKQAVRQELQSLHLDPPLSEIIHLMRGGWYPNQSEQERE